MIFLTVGTSFPFNRLVMAVDEINMKMKMNEEIIAQIGKGGYIPKSFNSFEVLDKLHFDDYFIKSTAIIAHAGIGTITMALEFKKPILVLPRLKKYGELVNDHQLSTARKFEQLGHVLSAYKVRDLPEKIKLLKFFSPVTRESQADLVSERVRNFLHQFL